jgi:hypothetical protein
MAKIEKPELVKNLEETVKGLAYMSEADYPFKVLSFLILRGSGNSEQLAAPPFPLTISILRTLLR